VGHAVVGGMVSTVVGGRGGGTNSPSLAVQLPRLSSARTIAVPGPTIEPTSGVDPGRPRASCGQQSWIAEHVLVSGFRRRLMVTTVAVGTISRAVGMEGQSQFPAPATRAAGGRRCIAAGRRTLAMPAVSTPPARIRPLPSTLPTSIPFDVVERATQSAMFQAAVEDPLVRGQIVGRS